MKRIGFYTSIIVAIFLFAAISVGFYLNKPTIRSGTLQILGLNKDVNVNFDEFGIPHIEGQNSADVFFALGFLQAQDRILQMEMTRRLAQGRLSEVIGNSTVEVDRYFRILGLDRYSKKLAERANPSANHIKALQSYLDGINAFVNKGDLPFETLILPKIEPFTLYDVYSIAAYMTLSFDRGLNDELIRLRGLKSLTPQFMNQVLPIKSASFENEIPSYRSILKLAENYMDRIGRFEGSNSIVVAPFKSETGAALLANDTHIKFSNPSVWYEAELKAPGLEIYGHFLPVVGVPLLGHNRTHSWAITIFHNDDIDLISEIPGKSEKEISRYDQSIELIPYKTTIARRFDKPLDFILYDTDIGPDVSSMLNQKTPISLRWAFYQQRQDSLQGFYDLIFANSVSQARDAAYLIDSPSLNISYANKEGDIAWWTTGQIKKSPTSYQEFIDKTEHPQEINPQRGYIHSTNNRPTPESLGQFGIPQRDSRLEFLVQSLKKISIEDLKHFQIDDKIDYHYKHVILLSKALSHGENIHHLSSTAFSILEKWDGFHALNTSGPTIFYQYLYELLEAALLDEFDRDLFSDFIKSEKALIFFANLTENSNFSFWDNVTTSYKENQDDIVQIAWKNALVHLESLYGNNPEQWAWGKAHTLKIKHILSDIPVLGYFYTIGPVAASGGLETLNNLGFSIQKAPFNVNFGPATRRIIDFSNPLLSLGIIPTGQSERAFDPHFSDQLDRFMKNEYRSQIMSQTNKDEQIQFKNILRIIPVQ